MTEFKAKTSAGIKKIYTVAMWQIYRFNYRTGVLLEPFQYPDY